MTSQCIKCLDIVTSWCIKCANNVISQCIRLVNGISWKCNTSLIGGGKQIFWVYKGNKFIIEVKPKVYRDLPWVVFEKPFSLKPQGEWNTTRGKSPYTLDKIHVLLNRNVIKPCWCVNNEELGTTKWNCAS